MVDVDAGPLISVIVPTARDDYSFVNHSDWRILDKIVECCQVQTFQDFELVIVDLLHQYRSDYFAGKDFGFPLLHIPDKKSIFRDLKLTRIASARNTGILYARGRYIVMGDDGEDWSPNAFERFHGWVSQGVGATGRLYRDEGAGIKEHDSRFRAYGLTESSEPKIVSAGGAGYLFGTLTIVSTDDMVQCNGFDEMFDGSKQLDDAEIAHRLGARNVKIALDGSITIVEHFLTRWDQDERVFRRIPFVKCNGAYYYPKLVRQRRKVANYKLLSDSEVQGLVRGQCASYIGDSYCDIGKHRCDGRWKWSNSEDDFEFLRQVYRDPRLVFNLAKLRKERRWGTVAGDPLLF